MNRPHNPWLMMWLNPRATIRKIIDTNPKRGFLWLACLYSVQSFLFFANYLSLGLSYHFAYILTTTIVLSPIMGSLWIYLYGWIFHVTGKWFGGKAPMLHVRAAFAWSKVPLLINLIIWITLLIISAETAFIQKEKGPSLIFINAITVLSGTWSFVLLVQALREVQGFSLAKGIVNTIIGYILGFIFFFILTFIVFSFIPRP